MSAVKRHDLFLKTRPDSTAAIIEPSQRYVVPLTSIDVRTLTVTDQINQLIRLKTV